MKVHLSYLANSYFYNYNPSPRILHQHSVLQNLNKNKDIVITKPNKGNKVVILDQKLYDNAIQKLNEDPTKLYPSGSAPACIHVTPKIHKFSSSDSFSKLHPIFSSIGTFNYNLAHFLWDLLSTLVLIDFSCEDTFSFVSQINNANLSRKFLVSYYVTSLFTNIPLHITIYMAINIIFNHNCNLNITKKESLKKNLKKFSFLLYHRLILFLRVCFIIKLME